MFESLDTLLSKDFYFSVLHYIFLLWPVWVPGLFIWTWWHTWLSYVRRSWIKEQGSILLEIKLPQDQPKSPAAMEFVLEGIWENANISTPEDAFWTGKLREWFSLEIVAIGGEVRFFIWAFPRWKKIIETRIYGQFPGAEVREVEDYARDIHYRYGETYVWGVTTSLVKGDSYPIKTYIEYELDKQRGDVPEEIVDPLTPVLEYLGTFGPHEIGVIQILIRAHASENYLYGRLRPKKDWTGKIKEDIKKIIETEQLIKPEKDRQPSMLGLTDEQQNTIKAMQRNSGKLAFDSMVRFFYTAPQDNYERTRGMGIIGSTRQFASKNLNGIKPEFFSTTHPWQDFHDIVKKRRLTEFVESFKRRSFFDVPFKHLFGEPYVLSTEEVATLFHIPGKAATTPTLTRVSSKKADAPANLPI